MSWTCAQIEERLSDYLDEALSRDEQREFSAHVGACSRCAPLLKSVTGVVGRMRSMEPVDVPANLIPQIIEQTSGTRAGSKAPRGWLGWLRPVWQPRFAMGAATVLATCLIVFQVVGPKRLKKADLSPVNLYYSANRRVHLVYARGVKFVNDLRVVYEIQSRLHPEAAPPPAPEEPTTPPSSTPQQKSQDRRPGRSSNRNITLLAFGLLGDCGRSSR
jgi:hypothetical protein